MKIACLGWGSLIWHPESLQTRSCWFNDGPLLPLEFARVSQDNRLTLVLVRDGSIPPVRCLWALMSTADMDEAKRSLAMREGFDEVDDRIGFVDRRSKPTKDVEREIHRWLRVVGVDAAIWTNSKPKRSATDRGYKTPTPQDVVEHLRGLAHEERANAEEYVRKAPRQIDTDYRRLIEKELGWSPMGLE